MTENQKGHLAAISANIMFGLNMNVCKSLLASSWMTPLGLITIRVLSGFIVFWIIGFFMPREKTTLRDLAIILATAFLGLLMSQGVFNLGLSLASPVTMSLIASLNPIVVLLLSVLFSIESITPSKVIGVIIGISGASLVVLNNRNSVSFSGNLLGILLALVSVICYSSHILIIRKLAGKLRPITMMKWMYLWAILLLSPIGLSELSKQRLFSRETALLPILQIAYTIVFASIISFFLMPVALKRVKASSVSLYMYLQPIAASTAAIIAGQDVFSWDKPLALILIVSGVFIASLNIRRSRLKGNVK